MYALPYISLKGRFLTWVLMMLQGNKQRILESIRIAKERGAKLRVGPELEISYV
jgi:predicted amidohydrolase